MDDDTVMPGKLRVATSVVCFEIGGNNMNEKHNKTQQLWKCSIPSKLSVNHL